MSLLIRRFRFLVLAMLLGQPVLADLNTLFTTPLERQIIDQNRYRVEPLAQQQPEEEIKAETPVIWQDVELNYQVSGLSVSSDGRDVAWINGQVYPSGSKMQDGTRVLIRKNQLFLIPVNGKTYPAVPGKALKINFKIRVKVANGL